MATLSDFFSVKRRYSRSVNLERDIQIADSVNGYIPNSRAFDVLERFLRAYSLDQTVRSWTLTGVYGSGKSAFADFLISICAPRKDANYINALNVIKENGASIQIVEQIQKTVPEAGLVRAVATGQREPISYTIVKALYNGASIYWSNKRGAKPKVLTELDELATRVEDEKSINNQKILMILQELAKVAKTGVLLILDELGKNFEFCAQNQQVDDLYLLQQIAELPSGKGSPKIFVIGLLHQSFVDYAQALLSAQRNEWAKIQGRFEDIPFVDSNEGVMRLIGHAIDHSKAEKFKNVIDIYANHWEPILKNHQYAKHISKQDISSIFPLHPFSSIILPILCSKFSQNDRSLFSFLASPEPHSFSSYLSLTSLNDELPTTLKLYDIYDYFINAGVAISNRPQFQRWIEIQSRISDAKYLDADAINVMKTIGILNLVSTTGSIRATRHTVALAMCDKPEEQSELLKHIKVIDLLIDKGFLTWRKQLDELRIWEGSDLDIEKEIADETQALNISIAELLNDHFPLKPMIARRHSYKTGTVRYFERRFFDKIEKIKSLKCRQSDSDGLICYWLNKEVALDEISIQTEDGKPVLFICASNLQALKIASNEYVALKNINRNSTQLQTDGVARREVKHRLLIAQQLLETHLSRSFDVSSMDVKCFVPDKDTKVFKAICFANQSSFQKQLSTVCNMFYNSGLTLQNELVNRRVTTSQGSAARRMLIEAMIENAGKENLGLEGQGPEVSLFESILKETGIYRFENDSWFFAPPYERSGIEKVWKAIEGFCTSATDSSIAVSELYKILEKPPYGVKQGAIPILFLSVLLCHDETISFYRDGTFVPIIGPEHFELLVKKPDRFAVKYFEIAGLRLHFFKELEALFINKAIRKEHVIRNSTVLGIVKPLVTNASKLPKFTQNTKEYLSKEAQAVINTLLTAKEPDDLLFKDLPKALGYSVISIEMGVDIDLKEFRDKLVNALRELQSAYGNLLSYCENFIHRTFNIEQDISKVREALRNRTIRLSEQIAENSLKRFVSAAVEEQPNDKAWLESLCMIATDKPPRVWTDKDIILFENSISDLARRFINLEALYSHRLSKKNQAGYDVRLVTITKPDGLGPDPQLLWIKNEKRKFIDKIAEELLGHDAIKDNNDLKQSVVAALIEKVFCVQKDKEENTNYHDIKKDAEIG